jgi:5-(aminomethyl)-3-furanmethanol phosphate kinase
MIVVKVGGSLYDLPDLKSRLVAFLHTLSDSDCLLVPGGGAAVDVVRTLDATHALGQTASHWLALRACVLNAHFLAALLGARVVAWPRAGDGLSVLDALAFAERDDPEAMPESWDATSDSIAARAAIVGAAELVLLKSVTIPEAMSWPEATSAGYVDAVLAGLIERHGLRMRAVNLREWSWSPGFSLSSGGKTS